MILPSSSVTTLARLIPSFVSKKTSTSAIHRLLHSSSKRSNANGSSGAVKTAPTPPSGSGGGVLTGILAAGAGFAVGSNIEEIKVSHLWVLPKIEVLVVGKDSGYLS